MTQRSILNLKIDSVLEKVFEIATNRSTIRRPYLTKFSDGNLADQADQIFTDERTLVASQAESLNLQSGLVNAFNLPLIFTNIKAVIVKAGSQTLNVRANDITGFSDPWTDELIANILVPGGVLMLTSPNAAGFGVTASKKLLDIQNIGSETTTYELILIGVQT